MSTPDLQTGTQNGGGVYAPPPYLSPSSIDTFRQCPLKYKYSRIDKMYDPPTEATTMGSFVHAVLEDLFALPRPDRTLTACRSLMSSQWQNEWQDKALDVLGDRPDALRQFRWNSWWCIENYFAIEDPATMDADGIEHELNGTIDGVTIRGFIDRWHRHEEGLVVVDYKTGKTPRPQWQDDKFFQLLIYADVLAAETGEQTRELHLLYLKDGVRLTRYVKPDALTKMRTVVTTTSEQILSRCRSGEFEPTVNKLCGWCSFKSICPAWI